MKLSKRLPTMTEMINESHSEMTSQLDHIFEDIDISKLSLEEIEFYKTYFMLLNSGAMTSGAMMESMFDIYVLEKPIYELDFGQSGKYTIDKAEKDNEEDYDAAKGLVKTAVKVAAVGAAAGIGSLYWIFKRKKALKLVKQENAIKLAKANAQVAYDKASSSSSDPIVKLTDLIKKLQVQREKFGSDEKSKIKKDAIDKKIEAYKEKKSLAKERRSKTGEDSFDSSKFDDEIDKIKATIDEIIGEEEPSNESVVFEGFSSTKEMLYKSVRKVRLEGTLAAKQVLLKAASDKEKESLAKEIESIKKKESELAKELVEINKKEREDLKKASEEEKAALKSSQESIESEEKPEEKPESDPSKDKKIKELEVQKEKATEIGSKVKDAKTETEEKLAKAKADGKDDAAANAESKLSSLEKKGDKAEELEDNAQDQINRIKKK